MGRYVALLRGINVGGNNLIPMAALRAAFEELGYEDVATLIASGNVVFSAKEPAPALVQRIEAMLTATFDYPASIVLRSQKQLQAIVDGAPRGFGSLPARRRYDVIFLKEPLTATAAIREVATRAGVDEAHAGKGVLYFSRLIARASQSQIRQVMTLPIYKQMTIRNWNTTTKLLRLMPAP